MRWLLFLLACPCAQPWAGDLLKLEVHHRRGTYTVDFDLRVAASYPVVCTLLADYRTLPRINSSLRDIRLLDSPRPGRDRVRAVTRDCLGPFFCLTVVHVQDVSRAGGGRITATTVPGLSDFREGRDVWDIRPDGDHTRIRLRSRRRPGFRLPPFPGTWLLKRKLRAGLVEGARRLERLAAARDASAAPAAGCAAFEAVDDGPGEGDGP